MNGLHLRWWFWLIIALALAASAVIAIRIAGMSRLADTQAELKRLGYATTMEELVALAPPVDADRQKRVRRIMESRAGWMDGISKALPSGNLAEQRRNAKEETTRDQAVIDGSADMAELAAIFDEGPVELSVFGWCEREPAKLRSITIGEAAATPIPNLLAVRACANWWSVQACLGTDPMPHLRNLGRLVRAMEHPGCLIDAMIGIMADRIRDQTWLWLATRGRISSEQQREWIDEMPHQRLRCAAGFAGERCLFQEPFSRMGWGASTLLGSSGGLSQDAWVFISIWPTQGYEAAYGISSCAATEAGLSGRSTTAIRSVPLGYSSGFISSILPNLFESVITATESTNQHRMSRLAALIAALHHQNGRLPDLADLPPALLAGRGPEMPPLRYETFPPHRFRIGIDPAGPLPPSIPADRWKSANYASAIGQPPVKQPQSPNHRWSMELDLAAILVPPPEPKPRVAKPPASSPQPPASP